MEVPMDLAQPGHRQHRSLTMTDTTIHLPSFPQGISRDQVRAALDILGIPRAVREVTLGLDSVTVTLLGKDADRRTIRVGDDAVFITVSLPLTDAEPRPSSAQHYIGQSEWCCGQAFPSQGKQHDDGCTRGQ